MRIVIDGRMLTTKTHGIAVHTYNLIKALAQIDRETQYVVLVRPGHVIDFSFPNMELFETDISMYSIKEQILMPRVLEKLAPDLYHIPTFSAPVFLKVPFIMTIHDLIHVKFPQDYTLFHKLYYQYIVGKSAQNAKKVITVSQNSKVDICKIFKLPATKVEVIFNGVDIKTIEKKAVSQAKTYMKEKFGVSEDYIMCVGNEKPHKNLVVAVKAYSKLKSMGFDNLAMVISGADKIFIEKKLPLFKEKIYCFDNLRDKDLYSAYKASELLLFPSFYEGFGYPPLEAMALGVPVVTADSSSLPEIVGDAGLMVSSSDFEGFACIMAKLLKNRDFRQKLIKKGQERVKSFTLEKMAEKTLNLYRRVSDQ
ncbi:MAG: glycosyltransferase family 4 protein [Candidatus Aureabacteria bacterium]|nr:glycosyltransferase family 4 protein [Candidatus Auribacterota bacterium]